MRLALLVALVLAVTARGANADDAPYWSIPVTTQGPAPHGGYPFALKLDSASCGACHPQPYTAWQRSLHAQAFSPGLAAQLAAFTREEQKDCLRCHAPREEQQSEWLARKLSAKIDGVDCAACHVRGGVRLGPKTVDSTPHGRVEANTLFTRSEFCAGCHQFGPDDLTLQGKPLENTYEEWKASRYARENVSCQRCHMPDARHEFKGIHDPEMTRKGLAVRVQRVRDGIRFTATNAGAGHHLPTYTTPLVRIEILAAGQRREHVIRRELAWDGRLGLREIRDTRLAAGESVSLGLDLPVQAAGDIVVTVDPGYDYHARIFPDLLVSLGASPNRRALTMLHSARNAARDRAYVLYRFRCDPWQGHDADCVAPP